MQQVYVLNCNLTHKAHRILRGVRQTYVICNIVTEINKIFQRHKKDRQCKYKRNTEWPKKMYTLFNHQYLWNKFK